MANEKIDSLGDSADRLFGLDVCRTIAILLVVCGHTLQHSNPNSILAQSGMLGIFGVDLFFCLSGFLIGRILICDSSSWNERFEEGLFRFWFRRWMRTLPLYFFYLLVSLKYDWRGETTMSAHIEYLVFMQNVAWVMPDFFHLSWSLAVEEWFYLTFPLVLLFFIGLGLKPRKASLLSICVLIGLPIIFRIVLPASMRELKSFDEGLRHVVVFRLDAIGFGVLMAYFHVFHQNVFDGLRKLWWLSLLLVFGCVLSTKFNYFGAQGSIFLAPLYFSVSALAFSMLIPVFSNMSKTGFPVFNRFVKFTSGVSYSLYLGHVPGFMVAMWILNRMGWFDVVYPNPWLVYPIFIITGYAISYLTYRLIERPALWVRDNRKALFSTV